MSSDFPIGTIVAFAGDYNLNITGVEAAGWLLCDGSAKAFGGYQALYAVIGDAFGADETNFHLPNLPGYFLRGLDPTGNVDQDGAKRLPPTSYTPPGNSGQNVGSLQPHGVGPHSHIYLDVMGSPYDFNGGYWHRLDQFNALLAETDCGVNMGKETRPNNVYVYFLIKYETQSSPAAAPGTVLYFAGDASTGGTVTDGWLLCDGTALDAQYTALEQVIWQYYGANQANQPLLPDYRAMFLRGVDVSGAVDPDSASRTAPRPDQPNAGNGGAEVGSVQGSAVAPHKHTFSIPGCTECCCGASTSCCRACVLWDYCCEMQTQDSGSNGNWSTEARPKNVYVDHLISWPSVASGALTVPVGAVVGYAGDVSTLDDPSWRLCDGSALAIAQYSTLDATLNGAFGRDGAGNLYLPDLRGQFLRGTTRGRSDAFADPDVALRTAGPTGGATANAVGSYQADAVKQHAHNFVQKNPNHTFDTTNQPNGYSGVVPNTEPSTDTSETGVSDTRPANIYVNFFIKAQ